ncbi:MAG: IS66 family insertion sequence element accessory protein TnpB [Verrucomicrobiae bacterium]|nr:IS66 family insertion sequence element accessory protein TnpB [Verrucomicrobiae bacterium]
MIQITPQMRLLVAVEPVDFRKGIDGLAALCRSALGSDPLSGALFIFRSRNRRALKLLVYDGQGFWLFQKRLCCLGKHGYRENFQNRDAGGLRAGVAAVDWRGMAQICPGVGIGRTDARIGPGRSQPRLSSQRSRGRGRWDRGGEGPGPAGGERGRLAWFQYRYPRVLATIWRASDTMASRCSALRKLSA